MPLPEDLQYLNTSRYAAIFRFLCGLLIIVGTTCLLACHDRALNNPHPKKDVKANTYYSSFTERPNTLDPARSYASNETQFIAQIYEPPLQYHYLKRPYELIPLGASELPVPIYFDKKDKQLPNDAQAKDIAYTIYNIHLKKGVMFQPHPAFAKDRHQQYFYHNLMEKDLDNKYRIQDFKNTGTRELTANDYVYQMKRLAHPGLRSPILGFMSKYIVGLDTLSKNMSADYAKLKKPKGKHAQLNLRNYHFPGAKVIDQYHYQIKVKGKYPQFLYWLALPFFSPVPWEADVFYNQAGMQDKNLTLDWYPVGTGAYMLTENNPNKEMVLEKNPNFHGELYPSEGEAGDAEQQFLANAGKKLPFIDKYVFNLEKESIPRWNKFLQGYYDASGISSDSFDQAIRVDRQGLPLLTDELKNKGIQLHTSVQPATYYIGFNMRDDVVGGYGERARKLRQAISIAVDYEDYISIFVNGRGIAAQGPIPPSIFGYQQGEKGINPYVYKWAENQAKRLTLDEAKLLLKQAGYPNGRNLKTGKVLVLYYDTVASSGPDDKARMDWMRKQFSKLGIQLHIRSTTYNRFQQKVRDGNVQMFSWGWVADYPDPENFLFLLYGPNSKTKFGGENATNYSNKEFDALFDKMKNLPNGEKRQAVIDRMLNIVRRDTPMIWGFHPLSFSLTHNWVQPAKSNAMANNLLKYHSLKPLKREKARGMWNKPIWWPVIILLLVLLIIIIPVIIKFRQKEHHPKYRKQ